MAKKKSVATADVGPDIAATPDHVGSATGTTTVNIPFVELQLPIGEVSDNAYRPRHVDGHLSPRQAEGFKRLVAGLDELHTIRIHGRSVSVVDAVRYVGDLIMDETGQDWDESHPGS